MLLEGRVAIISGVGPGLGRAAALLLAQEGADLALAARTESRLQEVAREVEALGRRALVVPTDVTQPEQAKWLIDQTFATFGRIDILLNNAFSQGAYQLLAEVDVAEWRRTVEVNLIGPMLTCKYVIPHMVAARRGSIINVSSNSARRGIARRSDYGASKAGLHLLTQSLAEELGPHGIRVNTLVPGHIWGDNVREFYELRAQMLGKSFDEVYAMYADQTSLKRIPLPEEIAYAVLFFACDWSSAITGQSLDVNAGLIFH